MKQADKIEAVQRWLKERGVNLSPRPKLTEVISTDISYDNWPTWAKALSRRAKPEDKGIGDVVARTIGPETSGAFKAFYEMTFGKPCGCNGRQKLWNQKYPLNLKAT